MRGNLNLLVKPPSMALSFNQNAGVVAFARDHYDPISRIIAHTLIENNIGPKLL
jgi:hypothetical protein